MSSSVLDDFLTKELFINKHVVTYRSLSRQMMIHINLAKDALATYYTGMQSTSTPPFATYMISGEILQYREEPQNYSQDTTMHDADDEGMDDDLVPQTKFLLVNARDIERVKSQFSRIHAMHIYSLSPSIIRDAGLVCEPTITARKANANKASELSKVVGRIVGAHVKARAGFSSKSGVSTVKTLNKTNSAPAMTSKPPSETREKAPKEPVIKEKPSSEKLKTTEKPKTSGKLDWSKARPKGKESQTSASKAEPKQDAEQSNTKSKQSTEQSKVKPIASPLKPTSTDKHNADEKTHGIKRKSGIPAETSDSESSHAESSSRAPARIIPRATRMVVSSDDEDDKVPKPPRKGKQKADNVSESERSLKAMMDIDDDQVIIVPRKSFAAEKTSVEDEFLEQDAEIDQSETNQEDSDVPKPVPKKRQKKVVPVGRNGLKKRKVTKTRTTTDKKGYMVTEDYSSYESVDENDTEPVPPLKSKGKKATDTAKKIPTVSPAGAALKTKGSNASSSRPPTAKTKPPAQRGSLHHFFGPEKEKK